LFDDFFLDLFNGDRRLINGQDAGFLAGGRAEAAGKFGKIIGQQKLVKGVTPAVAVNKIILVRYQVAQWAAGVAGRHPAVHTAGGLLLKFFLRKGLIDLFKVFYPFRYWAFAGQFTMIFFKTGWFTHGLFLLI
jgi:hypothetical protein